MKLMKAHREACALPSSQNNTLLALEVMQNNAGAISLIRRIIFFHV